MTTSTLNQEELRKHLPANLAAQLRPFEQLAPKKPVSGKELIARMKTLFTREEAEDLARRIEQGRADAHD